MKRKQNNIKLICGLVNCLLAVIFINCINPNNSTVLPITAGGMQPYTPESLGLPPNESSASRASLPVISANEAKAMESFLQGMQDLDLMTDVALKKQSVEAWKTIQFAPSTDEELNEKIFREMQGETVPEKVAGSKAELLDKESNAADRFFGAVASSLPELTNQELIDMRIQLTVALILIRLQIDFGDDVNGIPEEFLVMVRTKNVALRQKITQELIKRGVKEI